jgi:starch phosphorylase
VEVVTGTAGPDGDLTDTAITPMRYVGNGDGFRFQAEVPLDRAGSMGYTVRAVPRHPMLASGAEMGLVAFP